MKLRSYCINGVPAGFHHWCPACDQPHGIATERPNVQGAMWHFDGDMLEPTFRPSVRCTACGDDGNIITLCHYFITDGMIQFCNDNPHALNGQSVPLPDWPQRSDG